LTIGWQSTLYHAIFSQDLVESRSSTSEDKHYSRCGESEGLDHIYISLISSEENPEEEEKRSKYSGSWNQSSSASRSSANVRRHSEHALLPSDSSIERPTVAVKQGREKVDSGRERKNSPDEDYDQTEWGLARLRDVASKHLSSLGTRMMSLASNRNIYMSQTEDGSYLLEDGEDELAYKEMEDEIDVEDDVFQEES